MTHTLATQAKLFAGALAVTTSLLSLSALAQTTTSSATVTDRMVMLLPDGLTSSDPRVRVWAEAAAEEGYKLDFISDSQFLQLGTGALKYKGFILPDQAHIQASDALVTAIQTYVNQGGTVMLVYDFGALTDTGFYPVPKSRLSALAGVDYVLYEELRDQVIGLGPVTGKQSTLRSLQVPPGKSMVYATTTATASTLSTATETPTAAATTAQTAAVTAVNQPMFLPPTTTDRNGLGRYRHHLQFKTSAEARHKASSTTSSSTLAATSTTQLSSQTSTFLSNLGIQLGGIFGSLINNTFKPPGSTTTDPTHAVSGYFYGYLSYPSWVNRGAYSGTPLLASPNHGLVAGVSKYGSGKVLFVNTPLGYLTSQTDGMLMHGFLRYFGDTMLGLPKLATHPNGKGGLTLNWHCDYAPCINAVAQFDKVGVWNHGPFSFHITAGPDTVAIGDKLGIDLPNNPTAKAWLRYLDGKKHQLGSHGGWVHDVFGANANETNQSTYEPWLVLNTQAVENAIGHTTIEYSAPQGNNPTWAMNWQENHGVTSFYTGGHTGLGPTRFWADNGIRNGSMWAMPFTPLGKSATFEDFEENNVPDSEVLAWYKDLIQFNIKNRTSRLIYMHPPGAIDHLSTVQSLLSYAQQQASYGKFAWYTMADLAKFNTARQQVSWSQSGPTNGTTTFTASHPVSLAGQAWVLPKANYNLAYVLQGTATVENGGDHWLVRVISGKTVKFGAWTLTR